MKFKIRWHSDWFIYVAITIGLFFSAAGIYSAKSAANSARDATRLVAENTKKTTEAIDKKICDIAVPSWAIRQRLIIDTNKHSVLTKGIDPNSPEGRALQIQIDHVNKLRDELKKSDLELNGPEPCRG